MSHVGGGVGGGAAGRGLSISAEGLLSLPGGERADLTTAEGVAAAEARLDAAVARGSAGPDSSKGGRTELDEQVARVFTASGLPDPYNANTLPAIERRIGGTSELAAAARALGACYASGTPASARGAAEAVGVLATSHGLGNNPMEVLYLVLRESIRETNEDKKYFLLELQAHNRMAEELSKYLETLSDASQRLSARARRMGDDGHKATVDVEVRDYDLRTLDGEGNLPYASHPKPLQREDLNLEIKRLESAQETVRNQRQVASTAFQNFDQKSNQLFNMMSTVLKAMNEMRSSTIRNLL